MMTKNDSSYFMEEDDEMDKDKRTIFMTTTVNKS
jgi:hypothetical protein